MRVLKVFCVFVCLSCVVRFVVMIHRLYSPQTGSTATGHGILAMTWPLVTAFIFALEFYGIHKKARFAWHLGWIILAATLMGFLVSGGAAALRVPENDDPWAAFAAVMVGGSLVLAYWAFWWKRQKDYFRAPSPPIPNAGSKELAAVLGISVLVFAAFTSLPRLTAKNEEHANQAVKQFHEQLAAGQYNAIYDGADETLRRITSEPDFVNLLQSVHQTLGAVQNSVPRRTVFQLAQGTVRLDYDTTFVRGTGREQFVWQIKDNQAILDSYRVDSRELAK
jgi:hypothetical protein